MTTPLSGIAPGRNPFEMSNGREDHWQSQQYFAYQHDPSALSSQWLSSEQMALSRMMCMQDMDLRMFEHDSGREYETYNDSPGHSTAPLAMDYLYETKRQPDVDMGTPDTTNASFQMDFSSQMYDLVPDSARNTKHPSSRRHMNLPAFAHNQQSSQSGIGHMPSYNSPVAPTTPKQRPMIPRAVTAPEPGQYGSLNADPSFAGSEEGDHEHTVQEDVKVRGRKRQRIPHTAVERRYRENLNAHLDDLRLTVPTLNRRSSGQHTKTGEHGEGGVKPSKCEILKGAIEYITILEKENVILKEEMNMMKRSL